METMTCQYGGHLKYKFKVKFDLKISDVTFGIH